MCKEVYDESRYKLHRITATTEAHKKNKLFVYIPHAQFKIKEYIEKKKVSRSTSVPQCLSNGLKYIYKLTYNIDTRTPRTPVRNVQ